MQTPVPRRVAQRWVSRESFSDRPRSFEPSAHEAMRKKAVASTACGPTAMAVPRMVSPKTSAANVQGTISRSGAATARNIPPNLASLCKPTGSQMCWENKCPVRNPYTSRPSAPRNTRKISHAPHWRRAAGFGGSETVPAPADVPAPPLKVQDLCWWGRRFRLPSSPPPAA